MSINERDAQSDNGYDEADNNESFSKIDDEELFEMLAGKHRFQDVGKILHVGIIDYLTTFTCMKKFELKAKSMTTEK